MKYCVLDNGHRADTSSNGAGSKLPKNAGWDNCIFDTFQEALEYAYLWLGEYAGTPNCRPRIECNKPWDYSRYGDTIEIRRIKG